MTIQRQKIVYDFLPNGCDSTIFDVFNVTIPLGKSKTIWFGAIYDEELIGFACLQVNNDIEYTLKYIMVLPMFRCFEIGSKLLENITSFCKSNKAKYINAKYSSENHNIPQINRFFVKNNWIVPQVEDNLRYKIPIDVFYVSFICRYFNIDNSSIDKNLEVRCLEQIDECEIGTICKNSNIIVPEYLLPSKELQDMLPNLSVFVFCNKDIIGWCLAKQINLQEISIRSAYVREDFRGTGLVMFLWYEMYKKAENVVNLSKIKWISFDFDKTDKKLLRLYQILFHPYLIEEIEFFFTQQSLNSN